jgi:hypothetical protein
VSEHDAAVPAATWPRWALLVGALVLAVGISQCRAAAEVDLAVSFLERARRGEGVAELAVPEIAAALASTAPARPVEVVRSARAFTGARALAVGWGERCVAVEAVGTTVTPLWVAITEEDAGFRVSGLYLEPPSGGPCASD